MTNIQEVGVRRHSKVPRNNVLRDCCQNTTYQLNAYVKVLSGIGCIGVKNYGGAEISVSTNSSTYKGLNLTFTTGPSNTEATIYLWNGSDSDIVYGDDFYLYKVY